MNYVAGQIIALAVEDRLEEHRWARSLKSAIVEAAGGPGVYVGDEVLPERKLIASFGALPIDRSVWHALELKALYGHQRKHGTLIIIHLLSKRSDYKARLHAILVTREGWLVPRFFADVEVLPGGLAKHFAESMPTAKEYDPKRMYLASVRPSIGPDALSRRMGVDWIAESWCSTAHHLNRARLVSPFTTPQRSDNAMDREEMQSQRRAGLNRALENLALCLPT